MKFRRTAAALAGLALVGGMAGAAETPDRAPLPVFDAVDVAPDQFLWQNRVIVVFADDPNDPAFLAQVALLDDDPQALTRRDLVIVIDSNPSAQSALRQKLRPRGFQLVLIEKDGALRLRRPLPWDLREIGRTFDKAR
jgi:hypothetical protein